MLKMFSLNLNDLGIGYGRSEFFIHSIVSLVCRSIVEKIFCDTLARKYHLRLNNKLRVKTLQVLKKCKMGPLLFMLIERGHGIIYQ